LDRLNTPPSDEECNNKVTILEELPPTPRTMDFDEETTTAEEEWTFEDDENLLKHVLGLPMNNFKWKQVEGQFGDRHMSKMCSERWDFLKKQLLKDVHIVTMEEKQQEENNNNKL
jgi:hypothetical protein